MTQTAPNPMRGIFWMFMTGLLFVAVTALVKSMGPRIPPA
ncbi:MAG: EamA family transporter, partial [Paracoccaceae bacterium]